VRNVARGAPKVALLYGYLITVLNAHSRAFHTPTALRDDGARCLGRSGPCLRPRASRCLDPSTIQASLQTVSLTSVMTSNRTERGSSATKVRRSHEGDLISGGAKGDRSEPTTLWATARRCLSVTELTRWSCRSPYKAPSKRPYRLFP